jgi:DNA-nicking Smr family endonuclease
MAPDPIEKAKPKPPEPIAVKVKAPAADTLDGGWDRRLRRGIAAPDRTIDLHGHTLASAHRMLDRELDDAILDGIRILLVITGRPPRADDRGADGRPKRGLIRATIGDWLGSSRHAARIAAVRNAHPRHGGQGALYVILRRTREG